jgi:ATP-dependent RNA helicase RhlE
VLIGGETIQRQFHQLRADPHILIVTPGRMIDHLEQKSVRLDQTRILVLDEADRMLDMGFAPQINMILRYVPKERQTMLFSATMPEQIVSVATRHMKLPVRVEVAPPGSTAQDVSQELFFVESNDRLHLLEKLLSEYPGSVLVFTRTKFGAKKLARTIRNSGHNAIELHSDRSLAQRRDAMDGFKIGKYRILVATDIAARGIDVTGIELVVNYDLPSNPEDYVHRIGRTGRAGAVGHAISFAMPHQRSDVKSIEQVIRMAVRVTPVPFLSRSGKPQPSQLRVNLVHRPGKRTFRPRRHRKRG